MPTISIIMPIYNSEYVLNRAIDSVLAQTYTDFELILSDDGSNDKSPLICDEYAKKDNRIKVIHSSNSGVSTARNTGISESCGKYIQFIDADDYMDRDMLKILYTQLKECNCDMIICGYTEVKPGCSDISETNKIYYETDLISDSQTILDTITPLLKGTLINSPWNKLYKASVIKENNIKFNKDISLGEDLVFNIEYISHINTMKFIKDCCYFYVQSANGSLVSKYRADKFETMLTVYNSLCEIFNNMNNSNILNNQYLDFIFIKWIYSCIIGLNHKDCPLKFKQKYNYVKKICYLDIVSTASNCEIPAGKINNILIKLIKNKKIINILLTTKCIYFINTKMYNIYKRLFKNLK